MTAEDGTIERDLDDLEAIAVDLISAHVQQVFEELDARQLVDAAGLDLSEEQKATVADLIDEAGIEIEIGFADDDEDDEDDHHDGHDHDHHDHDHHDHDH